MNKLISILLVGLFSFSAQASLNDSFKSVEQIKKGPFGLNYLQGTKSRIPVLKGVPAGKFLFQAAFRNDTAQALANNYGFYTGNLYTTNYYELMGEYVYGDARGNFALDHERLNAVASAAMPKAASMVRHAVLEGHYTDQFPSSPLARSFRVRGISDFNNEQEFAKYFLEFFLSNIENDMQFLTASLLAQGSPIAPSNALDKARTLIATIYDREKLKYGEGDKRIKALYQLRNAIHNQLSQSVLSQIDTFLATYPSYKGSGASTITAVRELIASYYSVSARQVASAAKVIGNSLIQAIAEDLHKSGFNVESGLLLSSLLADLRTQISNPSNETSVSKTNALLVLLAGSQYLNKELSSLKSVNSKSVIMTVLNLIYVEGFLIQDNWAYFLSEMQGASDVAVAASQLTDIIDIAADTLTQAFDPALNQWIQIEPKMNYFIDNTLKSSAVNTAALLATKAQR